VGRVGIDLEPPDLADPDDARWLLACVWPGTGRFERAARAIELGQRDSPPVLRGDALERLPEVLAGLGDGRIVVLNSWSFSYFPVEQRRTYVELLSEFGRRRPIVWLGMDAPEVVELTAGDIPAAGSAETEVVSGVTFGNGTPRAEVLAFVQGHGQSMAWREAG
jgi:hypothetical protein